MAGEDGFGTLFARGDGAVPEVFTTLASVTNVSGPQIKRKTLDMTAHDSPDGYEEMKGGLRSGGEVTLDLNFRPAVHKALLADLTDVNPRNYKITFPDGSFWTFAAVFSGFENGAPHDDKLTAKATFAISGKPVLT